MGIDFGLLVTIAMMSIFIANFPLAKFLGLCPFIGVTQSTKNAIGMGIAVTFVMLLASAVTFPIFKFVLVPLNLVSVLKTPVYILVIATLVQFVEMVLKAKMPPLYRALGIYLPLITTNCAVFGVTLLNTTDAPEAMASLPFIPGYIAAMVQGTAGGLGFLVAMLLMSGVRERLAFASIPESLKGTPIALICTALMAIAFMGFSGMASL
ncbi:MAG TPA: Rnf-Nqr domain containing protein [Candidatus Brocadiia bacterium]|nr:Rnf-Nqr domain containing protein [Candidatus Brocadiia bacterium]